MVVDRPRRELTELVELRERLDALDREWPRLGARLAAAAAQCNGGALPDLHVIEELNAAHATFIEVRMAVLIGAADSLDDAGTVPPPTTLGEVRALLERVEAVETERAGQQARQAAGAVLSRVQAISHAETPDDGPVLAVRQAARDVQRSLAERPWSDVQSEVESLVSGSHPLASLLALVERPDSLDDADWAACQATVASTFGQSLAVAAVRGRLTLTGAADSGTAAAGQEPPDDGRDAGPRHPTSQGAFVADPDPPGGRVGGTNDRGGQPGGTGSERALTTTGLVARPDAEPEDAVSGNGAITGRDQTVAGWEANVASEPASWSDPVLMPANGGVEVPPGPSTVDAVTDLDDAEDSRPTAGAAVRGEIADDTPGGLGENVESADLPDTDEGAAADPFGATDVGTTADDGPLPAAQSAATMTETAVDAGAAAIHDPICRLILDDRLGLAYHLTLGTEATQPELAPRLPAWLVRCLGLARHVRYDSSEIAARLRTDFARFQDEDVFTGDQTWDRALRFFLIAAGLRPALLAPSTGASAILDQVLPKAGFGALAEYTRAVAEHGHQGEALDAQALKKVEDLTVWQQERDDLRRAVASWLAQAPSLRTKYAAANDVWRDWVKPGGVLAELLQVVGDDDASAVDRVAREAARLDDDVEMRRLVDETDKRITRRQNPKQIEFDAYQHLLRNTRRALSFIHRWMDLQAVRPDRERSHLQLQAERLRAEVWGRQDDVRSELSAARADAATADGGDGVVLLTAIDACQRAVEDIAVLFDPETPLATDERPARHVLHADLLRIPSLVLDHEWAPVAAPAVVFEAILGLLAEGEGDWKRAYDRRKETRDHEATEWIVEYLETSRNDAAADRGGLDALRHDRSRHLRDCRQALQTDVEATSQAIERVVMLGLLEESERIALNGEVEAIQAGIGETLRFAPAHDALHAIRDQLADKQAAAIAAVEARLSEDGLPDRLAAMSEAETRIRSALAAGDAPTANEYIDMVQAGRDLPEALEEPDLFGEFFLEEFETISRYLSPDAMPAVRAERRALDPATSGQGSRSPSVPDDLFSTGKQPLLLATWFAAKRAGAFRPRDIETILSQLGFSNPKVKPRSGSAWFDVAADPIADPAWCPIHVYGSTAKGRYRILVAKNVATEDALVDLVGETSRGAPVIVFHLGPIAAKRRRALAYRCRQRDRSFLVLDDVLLYFLSRRSGLRLAPFFACALPFTTLNPYTPTASLAPPEVFFGRRQERAAIEDPVGSCFIYGGRQLGKTVLLRDVERSFHDPAEGRVAVWLDLKAEGIAYDRPIEDIWRLIGLRLKPLGVVRNASAIADRLLASIQSWLEENPQRRALLLLDEADAFLASDGDEDFVRVARIKGLMDITNRRFKVVFAGLHNVQRTARGENQPLAHYGEPLQIGPLLDRGEWRAARALIERPLFKLGYRFESPDHVTRILARTNYYPSLIQLYCSYLIRYVTDPTVAVFDRQQTPPYVLTLAHVDGAYQNPDLRDAIRHRFEWTIGLDARYRVIAMAIAYESTRPGVAIPAAGFAIDWIREQAVTWWPQGFRDSTELHYFKELLEEMVGLGILRHAGDGYALRSPNVVTLLGTHDQVERELLESENREPPVVYAPATFRPAYRNSGDVNRALRSPLTALQESELRARRHGVSLVVGSAASGLADVAPFLRSAVEPAFFTPLTGATDRGQFARQLTGLRLGDRDQLGTTIIFVPADAPWSEAWVEEALTRVRRFSSPVAFVRIVFLADPATTWTLLGTAPGADRTALDQVADGGCATIGLRPWHDAALRHWLEETDFGPGDPAGRHEIFSATGNWPLLLNRLYQRAETGLPWQSCVDEINAMFADPAQVAALVPAFGLDQPTPRRVLRDLAALTEATAGDLVAVAEGEVPAARVHRILNWADLLGYALPAGGESWRIDPVVARILNCLEV